MPIKRRNPDEKLKPLGFSLTVATKEQIYKITAFLHCKRTEAVKKIFEILFEQLSKDKAFIAYCDAWDKSRSFNTGDERVYTSFYLPDGYLKRFDDTMYELGFIDRSPFLRMVIDYIYNHRVRPVDEQIIASVKNDVEGLGYRVENIVSMLEGKIFVLIENPQKKSAGKRKAANQNAG
jgi:hypothetical protein